MIRLDDAKLHPAGAQAAIHLWAAGHDYAVVVNGFVSASERAWTERDAEEKAAELEGVAVDLRGAHVPSWTADERQAYIDEKW